MRIGIGIPIVGSVIGEVYPSHMETAVEVAKAGHDVEVITSLDVMSYAAARNVIINDAIKRECEYLFFIDSDNYLPPKAFTLLYQAITTMNDARLVSGHYYRRGYPYTCVWSKIHDGTYYQTDAQFGVHDVDATGLGCALIDLKWVDSCFDKPFFIQGEGPKGWVPEDCLFCHSVKDHGGRVLGHAGVRCGHGYTRIILSDKNVGWLRAHELEREIKFREGEEDG